MKLIQFLEISVALIFFINKLLVLVKIKSGWLVGAIGAILATLYLYLLGLYVYTILEIGLIVLMAYGFFVKEKNPTIEKSINMLIFIILLIFTYFAIHGDLVIAQFISSVGMLLGTYFLIHKKPVLGWIGYLVGHSICAYLGYQKHQTFFADFQIASALVSIIALALNEKTKRV